MIAGLFTLDNALALVTLTALEIVLGIDNIVMLSIVTSRLPLKQRALGRRVGLGLAMIMRIALLCSLAWIMGLTRPLFVLPLIEFGVTGRALILLVGGLFLIAKATHEMHAAFETTDKSGSAAKAAATFFAVIIQVGLLDLVFSLDSVITAVGMAQNLVVMIAAVVVAIAVMMIFAGFVSDFIERHPTIKMLALSFLLLIGVMLIADSIGKHIDRGYIYFAMGFSIMVEMINLRLRHKHERAKHVADVLGG